MDQKPKNEDFEFSSVAPYWQCQACGYKTHSTPMPKNRELYYKKPYSPKCPKCKSRDLVPVGW